MTGHRPMAGRRCADIIGHRDSHMDDHQHLHGWNDAELDAVLAGMSAADQVRILRRVVKSSTATAAFYCGVVTDIGSRWGAMVDAEEAEWFRDRLLSGTQDLLLEVAAQIRQDQRRADQGHDHE
jgi:hypothetical protein